VPFVRVAFPVPLRQTFLYAVPDALLETAVPGAEVRCPFGAA
jgi:primosomal protein N'